MKRYKYLGWKDDDWGLEEDVGLRIISRFLIAKRMVFLEDENLTKEVLRSNRIYLFNLDNI